MKVSPNTYTSSQPISFTSSIQSVKSGKEAYEYTRFVSVKLGKSKPLANIYAFLERIFSDKNTIRVIKNENGKIIGGYAYDLNRYPHFKELNIRTLAVEKTENKGVTFIKNLYRDMKEIGKQHKADEVTLYVDKEQKHLIKSYLNLGFQHFYQENPFLYKMHMPFDRFEKLAD